MSISPLTLDFRGTRRIRILWTGALASGAFTTSLYGVSNTDGTGASPISVVAVFSIASAPNACELAINADLTSGAAYQVTFSSVPGADGSHFSGSLNGNVGLTLVSPPNTEIEATDADLIIFSRDLLFQNGDFIEAAGGDLMTITGRPNWLGAAQRRINSDGLPWDDTYGAHPDDYVDAPQAYSTAFAGRIVAQATADDRTKSADVQFQQDPLDPDTWDFLVSLAAIDGSNPTSFMTSGI